VLNFLTIREDLGIVKSWKNFFHGDWRIEGMDAPAVSLVYSDEKFEVWVDAEKDNITLSMTDRGVTLQFTKEEWMEFQEVIGNIMLEEQEEETS